MANVYTVTVVVEVAADNPLKAFCAIRSALDGAKLAEVVVVQPLQVTKTVALEPECTCRAKPDMACPVHGAECVEGGWED